jgi:hypothetical protein
MMLHARHLACLAALLLGSTPVQAGATDPLLSASLSDDLGLARLAEEAGDAWLLAHLVAPTARAEVLAAVLASPFARAPEGLLAPLATLACGRDPALAPAAARALFDATSRLSPAALSAREVLQADLRSARQALHCSETEPLPRADIRAFLAQAGSALDMLLRQWSDH